MNRFLYVMLILFLALLDTVIGVPIMYLVFGKPKGIPFKEWHVKACKEDLERAWGMYMFWPLFVITDPLVKLIVYLVNRKKK